MKQTHIVVLISFQLLGTVTLIAQSLPATEPAPLKNWAAPLYWQPNQAERQNTAKSGAQIQFSPNATSNTALVFVAVSPCRLVDTRGASAGFTGSAPFSGPYIPAGGTATFPVQSAIETQTTAPSPCGTIPSIAQAYSLNLTVFPHPLGTSVNYVTMWPTGAAIPQVSTLNDQQGTLVANAAIVPAGAPSGGINVFAYGATDVIIDMNGFYAAPTDLNSNTAIGAGTLLSNTTGGQNTAVGQSALSSNTTGFSNTASGYGALQYNTTGGDNMASGEGALQNNTSGNFNTASGQGALYSNTTGSSNTAIGDNALTHNTTGGDNTASGYYALYFNTTGNFNTATGLYALVNSTTGNENTATGNSALAGNTTGADNTANGYYAMYNSTTGNFNTAIGLGALANNSSGGSNIAVGYTAANNVSGGNSNNIHIGNTGSSSDSQVIRIGTQGTQTNTSIAGIYGGSPNTPNLLVCVDGLGTLGTTGCTNTPSSQRFKDQIADMGDSSSKLLQLRPVTFLYKPEYDDGSHSLQYGLIAEEVAKLYPEMVGYDKDSLPNSVKYQSLAPMLLNEVQKLAAQNRSFEERLAALEALTSGGTAVAKSGGSQ